MPLRHLLACVLFGSAAALHAAGGGWHTNWDEAVAAATEAKKPILIVFSAFDSDGESSNLQANVLKNPDFKSAIGPLVVMLAVDLPKKGYSVSQLREQNALKERFAVETVPTTLLVTVDGKEFGRITGFRGMKRDEYIADLLKALNEVPAAGPAVPVAEVAQDQPDANFRVWTDTKGSSVSARYLRRDGETIVLETRDGKELAVPEKKFSQRDLDYLHAR